MLSTRLVRLFSSASRRNIAKLKEERGLFDSVFPEDSVAAAEKHFARPVTCYCGFDPTAPSLHVGHLLPLISLLHAYRSGHTAIVLIGGGTAQVGDPSGRTHHRQPLSSYQLQSNAVSIEGQIRRIFDNFSEYFFSREQRGSTAPAKPIFLNNSSWYDSANLVEFLTEAGRDMRVRNMLKRESIKARLHSVDSNVQFLSYCEFSYQMLQAYDWYHLFKHFNCTVQFGGNDQLGNVATGFQYISEREPGQPLFGLLTPLLLDPRGMKIGKTISPLMLSHNETDGPTNDDGRRVDYSQFGTVSLGSSNVWLDGSLSSPFEFYQFFMRCNDSVVERWLNWFTFLPVNEIKDMVGRSSRQAGFAQGRLAEEVTRLVHGDDGLELAKRSTDVLYGADKDKAYISLHSLSRQEISSLFVGVKQNELALFSGTTVLDCVLSSGYFKGETDARQAIEAGGISVNQKVVLNPDEVLRTGEHVAESSFATLLRFGKRNFHLIKWM